MNQVVEGKLMQRIQLACIFFGTAFGLMAAEIEKTVPVLPPVEPQRVAEVVRLLGDRPFGLGPTIADRTAWAKIRALPGGDELMKRAEEEIGKPVDDFPEELFFEYRRSGNRTAYERPYRRRVGLIGLLVFAESAEDRGRFLPQIEKLFAVFERMRTWVPSGHDGQLRNYNGTEPEVELISSWVAMEWAQAAWTLGDRISPELRERILDNVRRRVVNLIQQSLTGKRKLDWWFTIDSNWNSVCLANVTGAALIALDSREDRALFVAAAEKYSRNYLKGILSDGYTTEGLSYWNYGFTNYVKLAEIVYQATDGTIDLYDQPILPKLALYPRRLEIMNGIYPTYADGDIDEGPRAQLLAFLNRRLNLNVSTWKQEATATSFSGELAMSLVYLSNSAKKALPSVESVEDPLRGWFSEAAVYVGRPREGSGSHLGVSLKAGHNAEQHNHNDVGSYVVLVDKVRLILDPGAEIYTRRTFGPNRYDSKAINSFGHSVPVVAGALQKTGRTAEGKLLRRVFTEKADEFSIDLRSCYDVPALEKLERDFVYLREGPGSFTVTDRVEFSSPQTFATTVITQSQWEQLSPTMLRISENGEAVDVEIRATAPFALKEEIVDETYRTGKKPTRLTVNLENPVSSAAITLIIKPVKK